MDCLHCTMLSLRGLCLSCRHKIGPRDEMGGMGQVLDRYEDVFERF